MKLIDETKIAPIFNQQRADIDAIMAAAVKNADAIIDANTKAINSLLTDVTSTISTALPVNNTITITGYDYTKTVRYPYLNDAYKFGNVAPGIVNSISPAKGNVTMKYTGTATPSLGLPVITKEGMLLMLNQANIKFNADIKGWPGTPDPHNAVYPREMWMVLYKPNYFMYEQYTDDDFYLGDFGSATNGIRFTNDNDEAHMFTNAVMPVDQASLIRVRLGNTASPDVNHVSAELWINGIKQTNPLAVSTFLRNYFTMSVGTSTNNSHVAWMEYFWTNVLTDSVAAPITAELIKEYNIGQPVQLPYATDINITYDTVGNKTVSYKYNNPLGVPEDTTATQIQWVDWKGKGPAGATIRTDLGINKRTVPANFEGTVLITVHDQKQNYFGIPSNKYFQK